MLRYKKFSAVALLALFAILLTNIILSSSLEIISLMPFDQNILEILLEIRLPRLVTAAMAGGSVAIAGALSQAVFRNALATPSVLGTEAGASLGLAISMAFGGGSALGQTSTDMVMVSTVVGAAIATLLSLNLAQGRQALVRVLLGGFALNALLGAGAALVTGWLLESGRGSELYRLLLGSFSARTWGHAGTISMVGIGSFVLSLGLGKSLDILALGDESAACLGISVRRIQMVTMAVIALLVGTSVAVGGALPFVSLIVPHFARINTGPYLKALLFNSFLVGAALTLAADFAARTLRYPIEINVGLLTTIIGAPYFIVLLKRQTTA